MKRCPQCKIDKDEGLFLNNNGKKIAYCRPCLKEYVAEWYKNTYSDRKLRKRRSEDFSKINKNRRKQLRAYIDKLKDFPCKDCGIKYPPCVMDFDHLNDDKKDGGVGAMIGKMRNIDIILKEIAKCELVCANCHRIRTYILRPFSTTKKHTDEL